MEIRLTRDEDIPQLKKLFTEAFDEDGRYTDLFFEKRYKTTEGIGMFDNGRLLSSIYLLPCNFKIKDKSYTMAYVFAVATFQNERGKGFCSEIMKFAHEYLKNKGVDASSLMPAEKSLFNFYEKLSYRTCFYVNYDSYHVLKSKKLPFTGISLKDKKSLRDKVMSESDGFLSWDENALSFCQVDNDDYWGGKTVSVPSLGENYAVCLEEKDRLYIKEIVCNKRYKRRLINALGNIYGKDKVFVRDMPENKNNPFGMVCPLSEKFASEFNFEGMYSMSLPMD